MSDAAGQRRTGLLARRALEPQQRAAASIRACRRLSRMAVFRRARRIGLYWPLTNEADPRVLRRLSCRASYYLPRINGQTLLFTPWPGASTRWQLTALGVQQPRGGPNLPVAALDLLIMPLAAFDSAAHRIGMGGGFYDRTLAATAACPWRGPALVGLAFDCQQVGAITPEPWDIALAAVVSESAVHRPAQG